MITLLQVKANLHDEGLRELVEALFWGLNELQCSPRIVTCLPTAAGELLTRPRMDAKTIIVGAHHLPPVALEALSPSHDIVYNTEQLVAWSPWITRQYIRGLRGAHQVWDFSLENAARWLSVHGIQAKPVVPAWVQRLQRIRVPPTNARHIDVLFYGSMNDRRQKILRDIADAGLYVVSAFACYGERRDALIANAKVILNLHYWEDSVLETVRLAYLLTNAAAIVSEYESRHRADLLTLTDRAGMRATCYELLAEACVELVQDEETRRDIASRGHEHFRSVPFSRVLEAALFDVMLSSVDTARKSDGNSAE